ncbi:zinc finger bed domain-containing protein 4 [Lasius niger]|uniref:Zinc finger bed domain-containing protein 4 n=1 Tax=Lasius niger TaxID=67767 RepID=A0A0J7K7D9_LASNI|nr:zinc finger bed domain-containing protein 4 [Lasius niger]
MDRRLTAENLRCEIEKILTRFDISVNQIFTITSYNGRNMIKATEILQDGESENSEEEEDFLEDAIIKLKLGTVQSVRCAAHTLQLAVYSFLNDSGTDYIVRKMRDYMKNLRTLTHRFGIAALNLKWPVIDIPTR